MHAVHAAHCDERFEAGVLQLDQQCRATLLHARRLAVRHQLAAAHAQHRVRLDQLGRHALDLAKSRIDRIDAVARGASPATADQRVDRADRDLA